MPIPYSDIYKLSQDVAFQRRVQVALWREANTIMRELPATPNHTERLAWAKAALRGPAQDLNSVMNRVLTTGAVYNNGDAVDDGQLQNVVSGLVNDIALAHAQG